jgi:hypothetical protein
MLKIFTIYDNKANHYSQPFFAKTKAEAIRSFTDLVNDSRSTINKHSSDFVLFEIGEFEELTAEIQASQKINLGVAAEFKNFTNLISDTNE